MSCRFHTFKDLNRKMNVPLQQISITSEIKIIVLTF